MQSKTIVGRLRHRFATCTLVAHIASKRLVAPCVPRQHQSQGIIPRHNKQPRKPSLAPQRTVKIGGLDRPILVAGISKDVVNDFLAPYNGRQRRPLRPFCLIKQGCRKTQALQTTIACFPKSPITASFVRITLQKNESFRKE